ncbi:MAG TPA: arginine deiminase-related protein [Caulobacteraceae bacterium]|nr:arginine deiminase-related protein [Caulobacteraceae bacterium]
MSAHILMTDPAHYAVSYRINPWMRPDAWSSDAGGLTAKARIGSAALAAALERLGARISWAPAAEGLPDLVFPANAAVVLDGKAVLARFRKPERRGEEPLFAAAFERLRAAGDIAEVETLPEGCFHEGAGDAIWDARRGQLWTGFGPRSTKAAGERIAAAFGVAATALELATERFYHLDTCFCPLPGGEVLYYPPAFTEPALKAIRARVAPADLIEATDEDAARFCVNAVGIGRDIVMASAAPDLERRLSERGYRVTEIDLSPFILSGGAAFCMTLRLDHESRPANAQQETTHEHRNADALA